VDPIFRADPSVRVNPVPERGLRQLRKARTRRTITDSAASLFAEHGYEQVSVIDIANRAGVSEQTVYNHFPSKERLVTDVHRHFHEELGRLIRRLALSSVEGIRRTSPERWRGELGYLAAISPTVHRLSLEMADRQAATIAQALGDTTGADSELARLQGIALAGVFQIIISEAGRRTRDGQSQDQIADDLQPSIVAILDSLDHWLRQDRTPRHAETQRR